jgi:hypothetical protein
MATILEHPDKDLLTDEHTFNFPEGSVSLRTKDGRPLDYKMTVWLLRSAEHYIMKQVFEED